MSNILIALRSLFLFQHAKFSIITFRLHVYQNKYQFLDLLTFFFIFLLSFCNIKGAHFIIWLICFYWWMVQPSHGKYFTQQLNGKLYSALVRRLRPLIRRWYLSCHTMCLLWHGTSAYTFSFERPLRLLASYDKPGLLRNYFNPKLHGG